MLAGGGLVDDLVLEDPGEVVGDEDGVEAGARAGLMSERGLLPIIQVLQASQPWWAARAR